MVKRTAYRQLSGSHSVQFGSKLVFYNIFYWQHEPHKVRISRLIEID